ncbi:MarR family transcriptional regulator [Phyllobacterium sp. 21LDTY02-6]|uniref:MarR family winged helix-turn-helix transcriptional regulator n=1 Tax=unclassified Phyllobacterium TaxID=2638441 RepID=UPI002021EDE6|nr:MULTISPECIES: MarR family transcriptional regulator [unclassified Phyllobacterium]MCO4316830.1 MarR family transcriptional regulator [Phyllobacterium sp. 21LDTY02-6]MCX8281888.1 MarR family transcriptional regulator [Phyllobacterium sp. 0TCS1.6C]MCX8295423.1 MarR family transcriptional regulator [Phyllobacterium sp. 0TCS1.6A]
MDNAPTLGFLLHEVARLLRKRFEQRAKHLGLTRSQWQTLAYLAKNEGIHQAGLAEILEIEPITLVRILDKLEQRGFIERRKHPTDRRLWLLYLKDETRPLLASIRAIGDTTRAEALADISAEDREHLIRTLTQMKSNLIDACQTPVEDRETDHG